MRIARILTRPNVGGPMLQAVQLWHALRRLGGRTLLVVGQCRADEPAVDLAATGIPRLEPAQVTADSEGLCVLPELGNTWPGWGDLALQRRLERLLRAAAPDLVHTHTSKAGWLGRTAAWRVGDLATAHTFHGHILRDYFGRWRSALLARHERRLARRTDLLLTVSHSCAEELAELGVAARARLAVLPPAVAPVPALPRAAARRALGIASDAVAVASVGRLVPVKRVEDFAQCIALAPWLEGHVFGAGPLAHSLRAAFAQVPRLRWHGVQTQVRTWLQAFDALVLTSRREGLPLVAVEAFEAGVPVVGYDVPGVRDAVALGGGLLVPAAAGPAGLANALQRLRADAALRAACIDRGHRARGQFLPEEVATALLGHYASIRDRRRSAPTPSLG